MLILKLIKRNILVYTRDRANIFFSLLSMLIIIGLMLIFLGKMNADGVVNLLNQYGGVRNEAQDRENANQLILLWTMAGIIVVNSVTITFTMAGIMVEDEADKRLPSFFVSPVNRGVLVMGYIIAAIMMGIIMCILTVIFGQGIILVMGGSMFDIAEIGRIALYIVLNVLSSACMVFLMANFVHSQSAYSGLGTIVGTLVGFLAGIYLPIGMLPEKVQTVLKCFPLLHGCSFMRSVFTQRIINDTFVNCSPEVISGYKKYMGISITWNNNILGDGIKVAYLIISGIIFIMISMAMQRKRDIMRR